MLKEKRGLLILGCIIGFVVISLGLMILIYPEPSETSDVLITKQTVKDVEQSIPQRSTEIRRSTPKIARAQNRAKNTMVAIPVEDTDSFEKKLEQLRSLSLSEMIPHLESMDSVDIRKLEDVKWFVEIVETETRSLTSEELIKLETLYRASLGGEWEKEYEDFFGYPAPPPGYTYVSFDGGPRELIQENTPIVRIVDIESEGYENWDMLSDTEWEKYKRVNSLTTGNDELWAHWNIQVSPAVAERADEIRRQLYEKSWGPHKSRSVRIHGHWSRDKTAADQALEDQLRAEAHVKLAAETPEKARGDYGTTRDAVIELLRQIEAEFGQ